MKPIKEEDITWGMPEQEYVSPEKLVAVLNEIREAISESGVKDGWNAATNALKEPSTKCTCGGKTGHGPNCPKHHLYKITHPSTDEHCTKCCFPLGMSYPPSYTCYNTCECHKKPSTDVGWEGELYELLGAYTNVLPNTARRIQAFITHQKEISFREGQESEKKTWSEMFVSREEACEQGKKEVIEKVREHVKKLHGPTQFVSRNQSAAGYDHGLEDIENFLNTLT